YRRIEAVSGVAAPETRQQVVAGYRAMTTERLASLHREFGFDYAVFAAPLPQGLPGAAARYRSGSSAVLQPGGGRWAEGWKPGRNRGPKTGAARAPPLRPPPGFRLNLRPRLRLSEPPGGLRSGPLSRRPSFRWSPRFTTRKSRFRTSWRSLR